MADDLQSRIGDLQHDFERAVAKNEAHEWAQGELHLRKVLRTELEQLASSCERPGEVEVLVLMCGLSEAPLLTATAWARPRRVIVVGSDNEDGRHAVERTANLLRSEDFRAESGVEPKVERGPRIHGSDPAKAFGPLVELIQPWIEKHGVGGVLIDITGGKKSMVAAAYLAASELGVQTQYVDFSKYESRVRLPYPCTAQVARLSDPAFVFRLRDVDRAQQAFDGEQFEEAERRLDDALRDLQHAAGAGYVAGSDIQRLERRRDYAKGAAAWQRVEYDAASDVLKEGATIAVAVLGKAWREAKPPERKSKLVKNPGILAHYVGDELWRCRRGLARAADRKTLFLRAYALVELMLSAALWPRCEDIRIGSDKLLDDNGKPLRVSAMGHAMSVPGMAGLAAQGAIKLGFGKSQTELKLEGCPCGVHAAARMLELAGTEFKWGAVRNAATHGAGSVSDEDATEFIRVGGVVDGIAKEAFTVLGHPKAYAESVADESSHAPKRWRDF